MNIAADIAAIENIAGDIKIAFTDAIILGRAVPQIKAGVAAGTPLAEIAANLAPDALAVIESVANIIFPGAGSAISVLAFVASKSHPMTFEEEQSWFDRVKGNID